MNDLISAPFARLALASLLSLASCGGGGGSTSEPAPSTIPDPVPVSILVEVYDPATNWVWENVAVRIVEADHEWSNCSCVNQWTDWYWTDSNGQVVLTEYDLAYADVGFREDGFGRAMLWPRWFEDEATVLLEVWADGFVPVYVEVDLCWCQPDVMVSVPFQ